MAGSGAGVLTVDLGAVVANWRNLRAVHGAPCAGVLKADGYGLGAAAVGRALGDAGCRDFFVAHLSEGVALRGAIGAGPMVAVLNGFRPGEDDGAGLTAVMNTPGDVAAWAAAGGEAILHVDTGINRLGLTAAEVEALAGDASALRGLRLRFVMTHLARADEPGEPMNGAQAARFAEARRRLPGAPFSFANSSGIFLGLGFRSDLARPGCALYGINPTPGAPNPMRQVVTLEAPVLQVREIAAGESVGYSATWTAARPSRVATVAAGYADGYLRSLSGRSVAVQRGRPLPLIGRVSMDLLTFDATEHPELRQGDRVTLIGDAEGIRPDDLAARAGTVGYEILTSLGPRYERRYVGG
ncbi:alanine racemase [Roseomonas sp. CCTCC AB2023176]|uniref:alanine racemase n=1 Tax=Roseomonas sp. CCTCC AB2023176 TaxID=3342640 RepID=UPI0035DC39CA